MGFSIEKHLATSKEKLNSLRESRDEATEQVSMMMMFYVKWKDLVEDFETMWADLTEQAKEVDLKEKKLVEDSNLLQQREKEFEIKSQRFDECSDELKMMEKELDLIKAQKKGLMAEIDSKKEELGLVKSGLEECNNEILLKKENLYQVQELLEECTAKLKKEERKLDSVRTSCENLESVKKSLEEHSKKLEYKVNELDKVEVQISRCKCELELKDKESCALQKVITDCCDNIVQRRKELAGIQISIKDCENELELKRKEQNRVQTITDERKRECILLQEELSRIYILMEKRSRELADKNKQHDLIKNSIVECSAKLKLKEGELELMEKSLKEKSEKLCAEEGKLDSIQRCRENEEMKLSSLKESVQHYEDINLKGQELNTYQISIEDRRKELELEEELLKAVKSTIEENTMMLVSMKKELMLIQKSTMECSRELESKQSNLDSIKKSLEECCNDLTSKEIQHGVIQIVCCDYFTELQQEMSRFDSLRRTADKRMEELIKEEKQLEGKLKNLEQDIQLCNNSFISLSPVLRCCIIGNGSKLQMLLNEQLRKNDSVHLEIFDLIKISPDPAALVLDAMQGFYPEGLKDEYMGFDSSVIRRSCVTLLEQIIKISPPIKPHVKEEAMKVAMEWKGKMKLGHENSLESLAFLKLVAAYKLDSAFSVSELRNLVEIVECYQKLDVHKALGKGFPCVDIVQPPWSESNAVCSSEISPDLFLSDDVIDHDLSGEEISASLQYSPDPAKFILDVMRGSFFQFWNNGARFDDRLMRNIVLMLKQLMKISPEVSHPVKKLALKQLLLWRENISMENQNLLEILAFVMFLSVYDLVSHFKKDEVLRLVEAIVHFEQAPEICRALGFTDDIVVLTSNLIRRKQLLEAARFSSVFELSVKFLPETILKSFLQDVRPSSLGNNSVEEQCKIIDNEVTALRDFVDCVVDCKLESKFPPEEYLHHIAELQVMKARLAQPFSVPCMAQQPLQGRMTQRGRNPCMVDTSNHSHQASFGTRKRPRSDSPSKSAIFRVPN